MNKFIKSLILALGIITSASAYATDVTRFPVACENTPFDDPYTGPPGYWQYLCAFPITAHISQDPNSNEYYTILDWGQLYPNWYSTAVTPMFVMTEDVKLLYTGNSDNPLSQSLVVESFLTARPPLYDRYNGNQSWIHFGSTDPNNTIESINNVELRIYVHYTPGYIPPNPPNPPMGD